MCFSKAFTDGKNNRSLMTRCIESLCENTNTPEEIKAVADKLGLLEADCSICKNEIWNTFSGIIIYRNTPRRQWFQCIESLENFLWKGETPTKICEMQV
jgi:hypothetical protein